MNIKVGDLLVYTGPYDPCVPEEAKYGVGVVVGRRSTQWGTKVTVKLENGLYADWPVDEVRYETGENT